MKNLLEHICSHPALEARWLNTLSLLEHIGARKIAKTVAQSHPTLQILEHYTDETRHAYAFKRLSLKLLESRDVSRNVTPYLCGDEAVRYFQELDARLAGWLQENLPAATSYINYLLTTSLIERRAMQLYPLYRDITSQESIRDELARVIQEEADHRREIDNKMRQVLGEFGHSLTELWPLEEQLFSRFVETLESRLSETDSRSRTYHPDPAPKIYVE